MSPELEQVISCVRQFESIDLHTVEDEPLHQLLRQVLSAAAASDARRQTIFLGYRQVWHRGVLLDEAGPHPNVSRVSYHPKPQNFTRAGSPGQPMLYASRNRGTVFAELGAKTGDLVQLIACRPKDGQIVRSEIVGEFEYVFNAGLSLVGYDKSIELVEGLAAKDPLQFQRAVFVDAFFAHLFSRRIPRDSSILYRPTAIIAFYLMNHSEALMFPSVQRRGGLNIAVPAATFDKKFEVLDSEVVRVNHLGYEQYVGDVIKMSERIDADGRIAWAPAVSARQGRSWSLRGGHEYS